MQNGTVHQIDMKNTIIKAKFNGQKKPMYDINFRHLANPNLLPQENKLMTEAGKLEVILSFANLRDLIEEELDHVVVVTSIEGSSSMSVSVLKYGSIKRHLA